MKKMDWSVEKKSDGTWAGFKDVRQWMDELNAGWYLFSIKTWYKERTGRQNRFYQGPFIKQQIECFKERWGETYRPDQVHDWNKSYFWGDEHALESTGEIIRAPGSSADNDTFDWEVKMDEIRQWFRQNLDWELSYPDPTKRKIFRK